MKKTLLALAVLAASGAAFAQSSVTLFGIVDATVTIGNGSVSNKTALGNSGLNSSRLGFRGTEDLGGGMKANFWLEGSLGNDDGGNTNLNFGRRSIVSLDGGFGSVTLGRDYTPTFYSTSNYDAFGTNGVGTSMVAKAAWAAESTSLRASNSIAYKTPDLGGFGVQAMYIMGETASTAAVKEGNGMQVRASYDKGPISAAFAYGVTTRAGADSKVTNVGGSYDLGVAKLMGMYQQDKTAAATGKGYNLGVTAPVGAGLVRASYASYKTDAAGTPESNQLSLGYIHNLSKRTAVYTTIARVSNSGGAKRVLNGAETAANGNSTGFDFGVRHSF